MNSPFSLLKSQSSRSQTAAVRKPILLVDDDRHLLLVLSDFLRFEGFDVVTAESAESALRKLNTLDPELIILDVGMPGIGGLGMLKMLRDRESPKPYPVLVLTARANMAEFFHEAQVEGFLAKPCSPEALVQEIRRIVETDRSGEVSAGAGAGMADGGPCVVLCESDAVLGESLRNALTLSGYSVRETRTGAEAIAALRHGPARALVCNGILEGMNGDALARSLRETGGWRTLPIILYDYGSGGGPVEVRRATEGLATRHVQARTPHEIVKVLRALLTSA